MKHTSCLLTALCLPLAVLAQGPLTPPGPPAPLFKTLDQIEPRTAITNLPITISQGGSYYLTKSFAQNFAIDAIVIQTNNVALDLCGFTVEQTVGSNVVGGIRVASAANTPAKQVAVRNGFIAGFTAGSAGVICRGTRNCVFENLVVTDCAGGFNFQANGTAPYVGNIVRHCRTCDNAGSGVLFVGGAGNVGNVIEDCDSLNNGTGFAFSAAGNLIIGCRASGNVNNYTIATGNRMGLIVLPATNTVSVSGSTSTTGTGTTDPFANLSY